MVGSFHIAAALADERERELRRAAEAARASAQPSDGGSGVPVRRRLMERVVRREDRARTPECAPAPARSAR
jgi:hypothetical protein